MARFYQLAVHPDLLAGWTLVRECGRIGSPGHVRVEPYPELGLAEAAGAPLAARKQRRGYA
jgi:predicted DNA-binding WGR domain protein